MPGNPTECRLYALRCLQRAEAAATPESRRALLDLAETWKGLAAQLESDQAFLEALSELELVRSPSSPSRICPLLWAFVPGLRSKRPSYRARPLEPTHQVSCTCSGYDDLLVTMISFSATGRKRDGVLVALALGHQGQAILAILLATAMAATRKTACLGPPLPPHHRPVLRLPSPQQTESPFAATLIAFIDSIDPTRTSGQ